MTAPPVLAEEEKEEEGGKKAEDEEQQRVKWDPSLLFRLPRAGGEGGEAAVCFVGDGEVRWDGGRASSRGQTEAGGSQGEKTPLCLAGCLAKKSENGKKMREDLMWPGEKVES